MKPDASNAKIKRRRRRPCRNEAGFSVVELLIGAFIMAAITMSALAFYKDQHGQYIQQADVADAQQNLRATMNELTRQIRLAGYRVYGSAAAEIMGNGDWLMLHYHDGTRVRDQLFYPQYNYQTGRLDLMMMRDGEGASTFAEGIDTVRFVSGGTGGIEWIEVTLVARSLHEGFQSDQGGYTVETGQDRYLYRRLTSTVKLRNR